MLNKDCPKCKRKIDLESPGIKKEKDGNELKVQCPYCRTEFLIQLISLGKRRYSLLQQIEQENKKEEEQIQIRRG